MNLPISSWAIRNPIPVTVLFIGLVIAAAFGYWAWQERVMLVNAALLRLGDVLQAHLLQTVTDGFLPHLVLADHVAGLDRLAQSGLVRYQYSIVSVQ